MENLKNFLKGIVLGISNIIPGVSVGTMAVTLGIYGKLIDSISKILKNFKYNFKFLMFIGLGILSGIILFSNVLNSFLMKYPWQMNYLFMGLIIGGIGVLFKEVKVYSPKKIDYIYFFGSFLILVVISFITPTNNSMNILHDINSSNLLIVFLSGFIASSAMVVPGISGSFVLILLGMYNSIISAVSNFNFLILLPFGVGVLFGLIVSIKIVEYLLREFRLKAYMVIIGLVIGSVFSIFPGFEFSIIGLSCIVIFLFGFLISFCISKMNLGDK